MQLRKINISALEDLQKISIQTFWETFSDDNTEEDMHQYLKEHLSLESLKKQLQNPNSEFYFAENKDRILGYLKINFGLAQTEKQEDQSLELERIYVLKEFLPLKIGQILLEKAIEIATKKNMKFIWLGV